MVYNWINYTQSILFPPRCMLCGSRGTEGLELCAGCLQSLPRNQPACYRCAQALDPGAPPNSLCGSCTRKPPAFHKVYAPFYYQPPVDHLVQRLKFGCQLAAGRLLGELLASHLLEIHYQKPELLLPVPLHPGQLRTRGFNQAGELAAHLSGRLQIPWSSRSLRKDRATREQLGLNKKQRAANLRGCFSFDNTGGFRHLAIVDDVVTTGATAEEISKLLMKEGVARVDILAVARTPPFH